MNTLYIAGIELNKIIPEDNYLSNLSLIKHLYKIKRLKFSKPVTFFVGENGIGKSTLIEAIAVSFGFNSEGGSKNFSFSTVNTHSDLWKYLTLIKGCNFAKDGFFLRAESFYNFSSNLDQLDANILSLRMAYGGKSLHEQSHGESFLSTIQNRFFGKGLYILDEPEAALSPMGLMKLISNIDYLVKHDSQFIISTHSPILTAFPDSDVYEITDKSLSLTPFNKTQHYELTRRFLENPEKMLKYLIG